MSTTITPADLLDLATSTLKKFDRLKFSMIATELQSYEIMSGVMKRKGMVERFDGGKSIQRTVMTRHSGAARMTGLHRENTVVQSDVLQEIDIPWRQSDTHFVWERRELLMNKGESKITSLLEVRRKDGLVSLAELMEEEGWSSPVDDDDEDHVMGIPHWVVKSDDQGFNGLNPDGFPDGAGGIDSDDHANWANYTDSYDELSRTDGVKKMKRAHRQTRWKSPLPGDREAAAETRKNLRIYVNDDTYGDLDLRAEEQNDKLGNDIASMEGDFVFKGHPIIWVPKLDDDEDDPIYMIDWDCFKIAILVGDYLAEHDPEHIPNRQNSIRVIIDISWNMFTDNRRRHSVLKRAA